jgi:cation-transporting ATPase E
MTDEIKPTGLTAEEVAERVERGEVNRVRKSDRAEYLEIIGRNTLTLFNALVAPAAVVLFTLGDWRGGFAVSGMAVTNTVLGLIQEIRGKRHLDRLTLLAETKVRVVREGQPQEVLSGDVVRGDLVLLAAGEPVVADGAVQSARFLEIDEALLTGESDPVPRKSGDRLLSGSFCVAGDGSYVAEQVGAESFVQRTAGEARAYSYAASPLQENINRLIKVLTWTAVILCAGYVVLFSARELSERDLFEMIAATITSMVPQGLVLMATLAFILGAVRLGYRGVIVRRLSAVETMASIDTLCMDKTGTLTTNRLHLERVEPLRGVSVEEVGRRVQLFVGTSTDGSSSKALAALRDCFGAATGELRDFLPFKSQNRCSAVRVAADGQEFVLELGAFEALQPFLDAKDTDCASVWQRLLPTGLRLLLFAEAIAGPERFNGSLQGFTLRPLAFFGLGDELRPTAAAVLQKLAEQQIHFKVLSGDHPETVRATIAPLAELAGLHELIEQRLTTGDELAESADRESLVESRSVFGRVSPWQKVEIVRLLRADGHHVAMIGDGVNDVLPIKNANLGIAMGEGSAASKTVAALVLQTNDFALLPATLDEGRTIIRNLRRAGKLFLVKNVYTVVLIVGALGFLGLPFPYKPQQVTLLNFLTIGVPALLIMLGRDPSPQAARTGFLSEIISFAVRSGLVLGAVALTVLWLAVRDWQEQEAFSGSRFDTVGGFLMQQTPLGAAAWASVVEANSDRTRRTMMLSTLVLLGVYTIFRALADGEARSPERDRLLWLAALLAFPVYLLVLHTPPLAYFFELHPLSLLAWGKVLAATAIGAVLLVVVDWAWRIALAIRATSAASRRGD